MRTLVRNLAVAALGLAALPGVAQAQLRLEIRPANFRFAPGGPTQQTFEVHVLNYTGLDAYSIPIFYDPTVVRLVSTSRRGELTSLGGGTPVCPTTFSDATYGVIQVDCGDLDHAAPSGTDGVAYAFTLERVAEGVSGLGFSSNYLIYDQDVRLRDRNNVGIFGYTLGNGYVHVDRPMAADGAIRTVLDFSTNRRNWVDVAPVAMGTTGVSQRIRDNGTGVRLSAARYDAAPPGGDASPVSDPDGTLTTLGTVARYWELTSSSTGAHLQDLVFSYAGLSIFDPSQLRLARRGIADTGTGAWQVYPSSQTTVNPTAETVTLVAGSASDVTTGQYALVANQAALPVELVAFTGRADGTAAALAWATASETNSASFVVEHRLPGSATWGDAATVAARGTTTERHDYAVRVDGLAPGVHTFRLRQIDTDGSARFSPPVTVEIGLDEPFRVQMRSANPVRDRLAADVYVAEAQPLAVSVVDVTGREVAHLFDGVAEPGAPLTVRLEASALPGGLYWLRGTGERVRFAKPFVVAR